LTGYTVPFARLRMADVESVGGKNASLGEMIGRLAGAGVRVPDGFATTAQAYRDFLAQDGLGKRIAAELTGLDVDDVSRLAAAGARIRGWILDTPFQRDLERAVLDATAGLGNGASALAVRSSATAEDLPSASFAGSRRRS
jgi:pyruvate,water dikinase